MENLIVVIGIGLLLVPLAAFLSIQVKPFFSLLLTAVFAVCSTVYAAEAFSQGVFQQTLASIPLLGEFSLKADALSAIFILIVNFTVLTGSVYGIGYMKQYSNAGALSIHYIAFNFLHVAMLMVCLVQNLLPFLVIWELMSMSAFLLVIFEYEKPKVLRAGLNYLVQMHIGVVFLIVAGLVLYKATGELSFGALARYFSNPDVPNFPLFLLFFLGFGIKAGFVPLHSWLAHAHPAAPSHVSGVMSGVIIKMGIYGIMRVLTYVQFQQTEIGIFLLMVSIITCIYGIVNATLQHDVKKMLAFHSIENIGIIGLGLGLGMMGLGVNNPPMVFMGFAGAIFHVLNHSLFKSMLFYGAGSIYTATHTRNIEQLGGLIKKMPHTALLFLVGALSISGLPPFNGFVSEYLIYTGILQGLNATNVSLEVTLLLSLVTLALIGGLAVYAFTKAFGLIFLGVERSNKVAHAREVNGWMLIPQFLIMALICALGLFPKLFFGLISQPTALFMKEADSVVQNSEAVEILQNLSVAGMVFVVLAATLFAVRTWKVKQNHESYGPTWGCGYLAGNSRMQYTASSYGDYVAKLAKPIVGLRTNYKPIAKADIFPLERRFETHSYDKIEDSLLVKPLAIVRKLMYKLTFIQKGQMQSYILYAFVFMIMMFAISVLGII